MNKACKYLLSLVAVAFLSLQPAKAQDKDDEGLDTVTVSAVPKAPDCNHFPFGKGCSAFAFGPLITSDGKDLIYGAGAGLSYFVLDRLALAANGGAVFGNGFQDYSIGPALTYYIGPFGGYLITPSVSATRHFLRGNTSAEGWAYGPSVGLMMRLFGRAYWGISVGYLTFAVAGYKSSDWNWSPVVFIPF
ncbi:MAG: hypothetical protein OHK0011_22170 [Turneriella sp.]